MKNYDKYLEFCQSNKNVEESEFFSKLAQMFDISIGTAYKIWYAEQRSWFKPEMVDAIIALDKAPLKEFRPLFCSGEFERDVENKKFIPEKDS